MIHARNGTYKLAKQTSRTAHFARVSVGVAPSTSDDVVVSAPEQALRGWRTAALRGAGAAIRELRERGLLEGPALVDVTDFVGVPADTSDADATVATFMAVLSAFPEMKAPKLELSAGEDEWILSWPP